jgi:hypothetical protein
MFHLIHLTVGTVDAVKKFVNLATAPKRGRRAASHNGLTGWAGEVANVLFAHHALGPIGDPPPLRSYGATRGADWNTRGQVNNILGRATS